MAVMPGAVEIVVPTFNNLEQLKVCLASIEASAAGKVRVLVCIDGSTDGSREWLHRTAFGIPVELLEHPNGANRGRAATRNLALPVLQGEFVLLLDSDMRLSKGAVEAHLELLRSCRCVSIGLIRYESAGRNLWAKYLNTRGRARYVDGAQLPFNQFVTANSAMRASDFTMSGGFDESIRIYGGEDTEFAYRLDRELGLRFVNNSRAGASTDERKTVPQALAQLREYGRTNLHYIHAKHPDMPHVFFTDRMESARPRDIAFRTILNPLTDAIAGQLVRLAPFPVQRRVISYQVIRAVTTGWVAGSAAR